MIKFTYAELIERAEGHKNYKDYVRHFYEKLREDEPDEKITHHKRVVAEKFGISYRQVEYIISSTKFKLSFELPDYKD